MGEITQESKELRDFVRAGEGFIPFIHLDQLGYPTVGIGHLLREKTVRKPEYDLYPHGDADYADVLKVHHYVRKRDGVRTHPFYKTKEVIASDEEVKEDFDEVIRAGVKFVRAGVACLTGPQLATQLQDSGVPAFQPLHVPGFSPPLLDVLGRGLIGPPALQKRVHLRVLPRSRSKKEKRQLTPFEAFYREKHDWHKPNVFLTETGVLNLFGEDLYWKAIKPLRDHWLGDRLAKLPEHVQIALIDLAFGGWGLVCKEGRGYKQLRDAIDARDFEKAEAAIRPLHYDNNMQRDPHRRYKRAQYIQDGAVEEKRAKDQKTTNK